MSKLTYYRLIKMGLKQADALLDLSAEGEERTDYQTNMQALEDKLTEMQELLQKLRE